MPGPRYMPFTQIELENKKLMKLRRLVLTPERLVRRISQVRPVRKVVRALMRALPSGVRHTVNDTLYGPDNRRRGYLHIPDVGHATWVSGRSTIMSGKARQRIGYRPRVGLAEGMETVKTYLQDTKHT